MALAMMMASEMPNMIRSMTRALFPSREGR